MQHTNMYSNIKVYQKYLVTSNKVGCATRSLHASSGPKAEGVPTNNQRGRGPGPRRPKGSFRGKGFPTDSRHSNGHKLCTSPSQHISVLIRSGIHTVFALN